MGVKECQIFFEREGQYYRLFITTPNTESKIAYLGIENYTGKKLASEKEVVNSNQQRCIRCFIRLIKISNDFI